ncbi:MAG: prephenate dehydrogenase [Erysipelotrichaceae bacterium]|nr:prephenate dehydrogenase [Erysipelotrichaceae bacterium]
MNIEETKIAIIGLGMLGGSYAQGLHKAGMCVIGIDIDPEAIQYAKERRWIEEGGNNPSLIEDCDIVISALYPQAFVDWVCRYQQHFKSGAILSDVTGVKRKVISEINAVLRPDVEFIACHPMAGREYKGIAYADPSQFTQANFLIVSTENNTGHAIETAREIATLLKFRTISLIDPEEHDRIIGFVSQLCHVIAVSLMNISDDPKLVDYTGDSFRDLTRIADINEDLWPELFIYNKDNLMKEIDQLICQLEQMHHLISDEDIEGMKEKMITATIRRRRFNQRQDHPDS